MASTVRIPAFGTNVDTTGRLITQDYLAPAYAATIALSPSQQITYVFVGALTGALTITSATTVPQIGDTMIIHFTASGANRTVTFSTGFAVSATTLVVVSAKFGTITCIFNGTSWVESTRSLTA